MLGLKLEQLCNGGVLLNEKILVNSTTSKCRQSVEITRTLLEPEFFLFLSLQYLGTSPCRDIMFIILQSTTTHFLSATVTETAAIRISLATCSNHTNPFPQHLHPCLLSARQEFREFHALRYISP